MILILKRIYIYIKDTKDKYIRQWDIYRTERRYYNWVTQLEKEPSILNAHLYDYREQYPKFNMQIVGFYNEIQHRSYTKVKPPK